MYSFGPATAGSPFLPFSATVGFFPASSSLVTEACKFPMIGPIWSKPACVWLRRSEYCLLAFCAASAAWFAVDSTASIFAFTLASCSSRRLLTLERVIAAYPPSSRAITPTIMPPTGSMLLFSREIVSMEEGEGGQKKADQKARQEEIVHFCQGARL